jgi:predicted DNA-binding ribbon-helix-helix protein
VLAVDCVGPATGAKLFTGQMVERNSMPVTIQSPSRGHMVPMAHWREKVLKSPVSKRSIIIAGHKTSVSLEDEFWNSLKEIARERGMTLGALVAAIDADRQHVNLSSAIRLFVLGVYRNAVFEGHKSSSVAARPR